MKHTGYILKFALALCVAILLFALTLLAKSEKTQTAEVQSEEGMVLQSPAFLKSAHAAGLAQADFEFILDEAGITAYTNLNQELDLTILEARFRTIRQQTDEFILGIITAPGYEKLSEFDENVDVQVFLHRDGWIVAYLSRWQTAAEIFDWVNYEKQRLTGTLIENVVRQLALDIGVNDFNVGYYDFRYPEATQIMLVAERVDYEQPEGSFEITIPRELTTYETSWSHAGFDTAYVSATTCKLNDKLLGAAISSRDKWLILTDQIIKSQLLPGTTHRLFVGGTSSTLKTLSYCGLAIVYKEATK
jgi:hypothetical protein